MRIRNKLLALTIVLVTLYTACLLSAILVMVNTTFLDAERSLARKDIQRIISGIRQDFDGLTVPVRDYALWDDTWKYLNGGKPDFIEENFSDSGLDNLNVSIIAFFDREGNLRRALHHEQGMPVEDCSFCPSTTGENPALEGIIRNKFGFLKTEQGLFLVVAAAIYKTDLSGPSAGTMVMARRVDARFIQNLRERSAVYVEEYSGPFPSDDETDRSQYNLVTTLRLDNDGSHVSGYIEFLNENNEPVLLLRTKTVRALLNEGMNFAGSIVIMFCVVAILFGVAVNAAFRIWIAKPLANIEAALDSFSFGLSGGDLDESNPHLSDLYSRKDEIGHFAEVIKQMHVRMRDSHCEVRKIKDSLEKMIQKRTEDLVSSNTKLEMFKKILENTSEAVIITDVNGRILDMNDAMTVMTGFEREELLGQDFCLFNSFKQEPDFRDRLLDTMRKNGHWEGEVWDRRKDGTVFPKWQTVNTIYDETGCVVNYVGVSTDISVLKEAEETLNHLAYYDPLTALPNRMLFSDRLEHQIACSKRVGTIFGLLFIDLDRFKTVNDTMGHLMGDALLVSVAERLKKAIRDSDTLCRIGGDEFALILQDLSDASDAGVVASDIVQKVSEPFQIEGSDIYIGASIGISLFPRDGSDPETLLRKADAAMYLAKDGGKGMYCFASGEMVQGVARRMMICGLHVHVGVDDDELRIDLMNQARYFLPHLLALSCSSPFWEGERTGLMAFRLMVFNGIPRTGLPETFASHTEFRRHMDTLIETGVIVDTSRIWWDLRLSSRYPTLETRIMDSCTTLDDSVRLAALNLCLMRRLWRLRCDNQSWRSYPSLLIGENRWRAMRYSCDAGLLDLGRQRVVPFDELLHEIVELVREDAVELGCLAEIEALREIPLRGTSAHRQLRTYEEALRAGATEPEALRAVVDWLVEETASCTACVASATAA